MSPMLTKVVKDGEAEVEMAIVRNGKVVYVDEGVEEEFDPTAIIKKLKETTSQREQYRASSEAALKELEPWKALGTDAEKVRTSLKTLEQVDTGKLGNIEETRKAVEDGVAAKMTEYDAKLKQAAEEKAAALTKARQTGLKALFSELIQGKEKDGKTPLYALGLNTAMGVYANHFEEEDGRWVAYQNPAKKGDPSNRVISRIPETTGEPAEPAEAFLWLVDHHPDKGFHRAGIGGGGSGQQPSGRSGGKGGKTISREELETLPQSERAKFFADGGKLASA